MSYIKGIDVYLVCCFVMTFASVIEYGMVSFVHRQALVRKRKTTLSGFENTNGLKKNVKLPELNNRHPFSPKSDKSLNLNDNKYADIGEKQEEGKRNYSPVFWRKKLTSAFSEIDGYEMFGKQDSVNLNDDLPNSPNKLKSSPKQFNFKPIVLKDPNIEVIKLPHIHLFNLYTNIYLTC